MRACAPAGLCSSARLLVCARLFAGGKRACWSLFWGMLIMTSVLVCLPVGKRLLYRYDERGSKNYKVDLNHYDVEHFRAPVSVYDDDVCRTYEQLCRHMPPVLEAVESSRYMFLQPINQPRSDIWFNRNRVSKKSLSMLVRNMVAHCGNADNFTNKSLRATTVTRMSLGQVPPEVGMQVTGHKRASSYQKYDSSGDLRIAAAQDIIACPYDEKGNLKSYSSVLENKIQSFCKNVDGKISLIDSQKASSSSGFGAYPAVNASGSTSDVYPVVNVKNDIGFQLVRRSTELSSGSGYITECGSGSSSGSNAFRGGEGVFVNVKRDVGVEFVCKESGPLAGCSSSAPCFSGGKEPLVVRADVDSQKVQNVHSVLKCSSASSLGSTYSIPYKIGDDIPFDEGILKELPDKSARALSLPTQTGSRSNMCGWNFENCVVNVYCGKENVPQ